MSEFKLAILLLKLKFNLKHKRSYKCNKKILKIILILLRIQNKYNELYSTYMKTQDLDRITFNL